MAAGASGNPLDVPPAFVVFDQFALELFHPFQRVQAELAQDFVVSGDDEHAASEGRPARFFNFRFAPAACITARVREPSAQCNVAP